MILWMRREQGTQWSFDPSLKSSMSNLRLLRALKLWKKCMKRSTLWNLILRMTLLQTFSEVHLETSLNFMSIVPPTTKWKICFCRQITNQPRRLTFLRKNGSWCPTSNPLQICHSISFLLSTGSLLPISLTKKKTKLSSSTKSTSHPQRLFVTSFLLKDRKDCP